MKYYLHTGLHKTGTKFFQHKVFPNLDSKQFSYNPPVLCQLIVDLIKAEPCDVEPILTAIAEEKARLAQEDNRDVLISREIMSGDLFSFYEDYQSNYGKLAKAFPEAQILCSLRYQVDWIVSCYRETLHEHHYQRIQQFLGLQKGSDKFAKADYKTLDWNKIVDTLTSLFPKNNLHFFFYEDFKQDKLAMVEKFATILGLENIEITNDSDKIPNRGYSAFSINLSIARYKICSVLGLDEWLVHRPIYFFGENGIPAGFQHLSRLPKEKYWNERFLRDNEEVRSRNYPEALSLVERIKLKLGWRSIIKKGVDKLFYWDWELLAEERLHMGTFFKERNRYLAEKHADVLGKLPSIYTDN